MRTQSRIEATLTALERLAQGELTTADDFVPVDVTELLDRAAHDAMHNYPGLDVSLASSTTVLMLGLPAGLRLVIDNAIANAVKHGGATQVRLSVLSSAAASRSPSTTTAPGAEEERAAVFERFHRGTTASRSGSGLGLALVAQQAEMHGGTAALEVSPLGGTRLMLRLPGPGPHLALRHPLRCCRRWCAGSRRPAGTAGTRRRRASRRHRTVLLTVAPQTLPSGDTCSAHA